MTSGRGEAGLTVSQRAVAALASVRPNQVAFISGAGISMDSPTGNPSGLALTLEAIHRFFEADTAENLTRIYSSLEMDRRVPRLEVVLASIYDVYGGVALEQFLEPLSAAQPNPLHQFFADHLKLGGFHATANFDDLIEQCGNGPYRQPFHFHGRLHFDSPDDLGARFEVIELGFSTEVMTRFDSILSDPNVECVVFVGYSGQDFYDATPFLSNRLGSDSKSVMWIHHEGSPLARGSLLESLMNAREVLLAECHTGELLREVAGAWQIPWAPTIAQRPDRLSPRMELDTLLAVRATANLFGRMGLRDLTLETANRIPPSSRTSADWERIGDAYWGRGEYRLARAALLRATSEMGPDEVFARRERKARILWVRGSYLRALFACRGLVEDVFQDESTVEPRTKLRILETSARVLHHMSLCPDVHFMVRDAEVARVQGLIARELETSGDSVPVAIRNGAASAAADLEDVLRNAGVRVQSGKSAVPADYVESFGQSDMLHAWLNFRHGQLRRDAGQMTPDAYHSAIRRLRRHQGCIGALADVHRTLLLPGESDYYSIGEIWRSFEGVDFTRWHRFRLSAGLVLRKARSAIRSRSAALASSAE